MQYGHLQIPVLALLSFVSLLFPVIAGAVRWKNLSRQMRVLLYLLSFYAVVFSVQFTLAYHRMNTNWMWNSYSFIEFIVMASVFVSWTRDERMKHLFIWFIGIVTAFWTIGKLSFEPVTIPPNYTAPAESIAIVAIAIYQVIVLVRDELRKIFRDEKFWIAIGAITYFAGTMPLFAVVNKIFALPLEDFFSLWKINWALTIVENILFSVGFICRPQKNELEMSN